MRTGISFTVSPADRKRLTALINDRNSPHKHVWRAEIVLLSADGVGTVEIMRHSGKSKTCVWRWQERFAEQGFEGLLRDKTRPSRIPPLGPEVGERVVVLTLADPPGETTHWTADMMAKAAGISASAVRRLWKAHGLRPHCWRRFKLSNDPKFVDKLRDVVGLYVDPPGPRHRAVGRREEPDPGARPHPTRLAHQEGTPRHMTHDYKRHGTTTLFRRPQRARRHGHRAQYAAPSPSGVHPLPQRHQRRGAGRPGRSRHPRQLCRPQASQGAPMARPSRAIHLPLHARLPVRGSTPSRASSPSCRSDASSAACSIPSSNSRPPSTASSPNTTTAKALQMDRRPRQDHRRRQTSAPSVRLHPLAPYGKRKRGDIFFASYANRAACKECQLKSKCRKRAFFRVLRYVGLCQVCYSARQFDPPVSRGLNRLARRSASNCALNNTQTRTLTPPLALSVRPGTL